MPIKSVTLFDNGMLMVFDDRGQQMPEYQGVAEEFLAKALKDAPDGATFSMGNYRQGVAQTTRDVLATMAKSFER